MIVKCYYNVYIKCGDILEGEQVGSIFNIRINVGYYVLIFLFIYVFDYVDFIVLNLKLVWVDVFDFINNLVRFKDYL